MLPALTLVVPCYNEEESLPITAATLAAKLEELAAKERIDASSRVLFVDDGSADGTWSIINSLSKSSRGFTGIKLSRNVGHQNALIAGLEHVTSEICISIDADLQDDVNAIDAMVEHYHDGFQVVYGVRRDRSSDSLFKRKTAKAFYSLMSKLGVESVDNHADFRLLSAKALKALLSLRETNVYLRGMVPLVGFPASSVYYDRSARFAGESKYPFRKMLALAIHGVTSLSVAPLRLIAILGLTISFFAGVLSIWVIASKLFGHPTQGWASTTLVTFFMGGVQMLALGVVGEYIGCIYLEVKRRPKYFVERTTKDENCQG
ncbi:glycosyltransferase family 2 protein [Caballeronia humi]|uniref:Bactoprenol glucosyl transferase n=1 Tax=Caballeronia humi TaxID=326474 RepID=A0A158IS89_9BURK|nr:glycosyltransferase family 2 protein [Caballeronia humi]SAL59039.1 bactoprenol glucosyl transferase [Caballeronia humi]